MVDYWIMDDDPYMDTKNKVLKNLADITDSQQLIIYEDAVADASILEIMPIIQNRKIDFELWKDIHKIMFSDVYEWAGSIRTVRMSKGISLFANPQFIEHSAKDAFKQLEKENYLAGLSFEKICTQLSYYYNTLNAIHPFREGNGRTLKVIITEIARRVGYDISWEKLSFKENIAASIAGFNCDYDPFDKIFKNILSPL